MRDWHTYCLPPFDVHQSFAMLLPGICREHIVHDLSCAPPVSSSFSLNSNLLQPKCQNIYHPVFSSNKGWREGSERVGDEGEGTGLVIGRAG